MGEEHFQVAVVGCGVSGASAALSAARKGASVIILEEHGEVGNPSHCSGHVGILGFRRFAPSIPSEIIENEIRGALLYPPQGEPLVLRRDAPVTWVLDRARLDQYLASLATKNGARLELNARVEGVDHHGNFELNVAGRESKVECRVVIDAGGCGAPVSRYCGLLPKKGRTLVNSAQVNVDGMRDVDEDMVEVYLGKSYAPGFFAWIIPRRDGSAKVGVAADPHTNIRHCLERFLRKHPVASAKMRNAKFLTAPRYHPIPVGGAVGRSYIDGVLAVGDAASQVKPTTGGGILFSIICGRLAGEVAAEAVAEGNTSSSYFARYEEHWRRVIGFDLKSMLWLRRLLNFLSDDSVNRIFMMARYLKVDSVLNGTSDIDFQGRTLASLARDPRLLLTLVSAAVLSTPTLMSRGKSR